MSDEVHTRKYPVTQPGRLHYLDALRATIMCIGIFVHASLWADIKDGVPTWITVFSHLFRMKLFIFLGGYFIALQIPKRGISYVVKDRARRLGVPSLLFLAIFNPMTIYIWSLERYNYPQFFYYFINMPTSELDTHGAGWHLHIWFLIVLLGHCLTLPFIDRLLRNQYIEHAVGKLSNAPELLLVAGLAYATSFLFLCGRVVHFLTFQQLLHGGPLNYLVQAYFTYMPFFILGILAFRNEHVFRSMHRISLPQTCIALVIWITCRVYYTSIDALGGTFAAESTKHFSQELLGFYIGCILLRAFSKYASHPSATARFISDASYTVYLFHMIIIVIVQWATLQFTQNPIVVYTISLPVTFILCLAIHKYVVDKTALAGFLLNGRPLTASNSHATAADAHNLSQTLGIPK